MSNKNNTIGLVALAIFAVLGLAFVYTSKSSPAASQIAGGSGTPTVLDNLNLTGVLQASVGIGNPLVSNTCPAGFQTQFGGLCTYSWKIPLTAATTTPCSVALPASATTSVVFAALNVTVASSTATTWTLATSSSAFSTTSPLSGMSALSIGSGAQGQFTFEPTINNSVNSPGTFLNWSVAGTQIADPTKLLGFCSGTVIAI